ncbi:MAG: EVE domain-containing protein [Rhodospirillales bacterium]|nr:EVE domain-containing protein [Rhodospirillales bacterium]
MRYWLMKSEPSVWSWNQQCAVRSEPWTGVRNHQAAAAMKAMSPGDQAFFYHSNEGREIVGIVEIISGYEPDPTDKTGRFGMVHVRAIRPLPRAVKLSDIRANPAFSDFALVRQSRLSVLPVTPEQWLTLCAMGGEKTLAG